MSISIRLSRKGKKNQPIYRVIVCETRYKRDGKSLDILGTYNPNTLPPIIDIDQKKIEDWTKKGAIISSGLRKIINKL